VAVTFLVMVAAAGLLTSSYPQALTALKAANRGALAADALAALAAAAGMSFALSQALAALAAAFPAQALFFLGDADLIASAAPAVAAVAEAARFTLTGAAAIAALALAVRLMPKPWMLAPLALAGVLALISGDARTPGELALQCLLAFLEIACVAAFCRFFARGNYLAYLLALWLIALRAPAAALFDTRIPFLHVQAWGIVAAAAAVVVWAVYPALRRGPATRTP
jgi:hypothetical protein